MVLIIVSAIIRAAWWNEQGNIDGDSYDNRSEYINSRGIEEKRKEEGEKHDKKEEHD